MPELDDGEWARNWDKCRNCDTTNKKHYAKGFCKPCYFKKYMKKYRKEKAKEEIQKDDD